MLNAVFEQLIITKILKDKESEDHNFCCEGVNFDSDDRITHSEVADRHSDYLITHSDDPVPRSNTRKRYSDESITALFCLRSDFYC